MGIMKEDFNKHKSSTEVFVMWDLDGTVFDTEAGPTNSVAKIVSDLAHENGVKISTAEVARDYAGLSQFSKFELMAQNFGKVWDAEKIQQLGEEHERRKSEIYQKPELPFVTGAKEAIEAIDAEKGWSQCIVSTNPSARSRMGLTKMGVAKYFGDKFYGPDQVNNQRKPKPDSFIFAVKNNMPAELYVGIEDSEPGIKAFKEASAILGFKALSIAYLDPVFKGSDAKIASLKAAGADIVIEKMADAIPAIKDYLDPKKPVNVLKVRMGKKL